MNFGFRKLMLLRINSPSIIPSFLYLRSLYVLQQKNVMKILSGFLHLMLKKLENSEVNFKKSCKYITSLCSSFI